MKIDCDLHMHTHLSLCANETATAQNYIDNARRLGIKTLGIADHMWDDENLPWNIAGDEFSARTIDWGKGYKIQNYSYICQSREEFRQVDCSGIRVLFGCECEYDYLRRRPAITVETAKKLDFIIVPNSHTHLTMPQRFYHPYEKHIQFMTDAFMDIVNSDVAPYITAVAHPFDAVCCEYDKNILHNMMTEEQYKECFYAAKQKDIAIEINVSGMKGLTGEQLIELPQTRMFRYAKEVGCKFTFGTDTHSGQDQLDTFVYAEKMARILGLTENDLCPITKIDI